MYKRVVSSNFVSISFTSSFASSVEAVERYLNTEEFESDAGIDFTIEAIGTLEISPQAVVKYGSMKKSLKVFKSTELIEYCYQNNAYLLNPRDMSYIILKDHKRFILFSENEISCNTILVRMLREILYRSALNGGCISLHAAAIKSNNSDSYIVVGPSGAGKTTFISMALFQSDWGFICNDRTLINRSGSMAGLPLPIRIGFGLAQGNQSFRKGIMEHGSINRHNNGFVASILSKDSSLDWSFGSSDKLELLPSEFTSMLRSRKVGSGRLRAFIIPSISSKNCLTVEEVGKDQIKANIYSELHSPFDHLWPDPWLVCSDPKSEEVKKTISDLSTMYPAYRVSFPKAWNGDHSIETRVLLEGLG